MKRHILTLACASALLAACGGGDDTAAPAPAAPPVTEAVPPGASVTVDAYIAYLKALVVAMADTLEPVDVSQVTPPTTETAEPTPVD